LRVQVRRQAVPPASQTMIGVQVSVSGAGQAWSAVQNEALRAWPPVQLGGVHMLPAAYSRQRPAPSQRPSVPQEGGF
jgi:hypothetical protein